MLDINDFTPEKAELKLADKPGKTYTLNKVTLRRRIWIQNKFNEDKIREIFERNSLPEISEIAYYLLEEKTDFPTIEDFQDAVVTKQDFINLTKALLTTIGISEPALNKLLDEEKKSQGNPLIGEKSTIPLPASTTTP